MATRLMCSTKGEERDNTNFKFVRWADVAHAMGLTMDTTDRVRKQEQ